MLDEVRQEMAGQHLRDAGLSLVDVALMLGFSDQSTFQRAFKRWFGVSPGVLHRGNGAFHQGSEGELDVEAHPMLTPFFTLFSRAGLPLQQQHNMLAIQWAKLLLNLNNPINALSGIPLKAELSQRAYRRCVALVQQEGLALLDAIGIKPAKLISLIRSAEQGGRRDWSGVELLKELEKARR